MEITTNDAASALRDAQNMEQRSARLHGYEMASPHFLIWGTVWAIGYTLSWRMPSYTNTIWLTLVVLGMLGSTAASWGRGNTARPRIFVSLMAIYVVFDISVLLVMQPQNMRQPAAFYPLVTASAYAIAGVFGAPRFLVLGAGVAALTMAGYFALGDLFLPWMAMVGGGGLILGGLWLRRV